MTQSVNCDMQAETSRRVKLAHQRSLGQVSSYTCVMMLHIVSCHACSQTADLLGWWRKGSAGAGWLCIADMPYAKGKVVITGVLMLDMLQQWRNCRLTENPCLAASSLNCCFNCIWLVHVQVDCSAPVVLDVATTSQPNEMERLNNFYGSFMHVLILLAMNHSACLFSYMLQPHAPILSDSAMLPSFPVQLAPIDHV